MISTLAAIARARRLRNAAKPVHPLLMTFNVTDRCNAKCAMCEIHKWSSGAEKELSVDDYARVVRDPAMSRLQVARITGGEPFLRDDLADIFRLTVDYTACRIFYITTNGSMPDRVERFVRGAGALGEKLHIQVSLDAVDGTHDAIRGVEGFEARAIETLRRLSELKKEFGFHAGINQTVMKGTAAQMYAIHDLAAELGVGHNMFLGARYHEGKGMEDADPFSAPLGFEPEDGMTPVEVESFYRIHREIKDRADSARRRGEFAGAFLRDVSEEYLNEGGRNRALLKRFAPAPPCMAMFTHFRLTSGGDVIPCSVMRGDSAGNVTEQRFSEIWHGAAADAARRKVIACKGCWIECDINPSVFFSGDVISWFAKKMAVDPGFRSRYARRMRF
ncbi:MAG TPA: radical SAM protein [bacterium]|nr:radical SAM protein [bacterium]